MFARIIRSMIFFVNIHRSSQATKPKSAATKFTFAATFCSIIIEMRPTEDISQRRTKQLSLE